MKSRDKSVKVVESSNLYSAFYVTAKNVMSNDGSSSHHIKDKLAISRPCLWVDQDFTDVIFTNESSFVLRFVCCDATNGGFKATTVEAIIFDEFLLSRSAQFQCLKNHLSLLNLNH